MRVRKLAVATPKRPELRDEDTTRGKNLNTMIAEVGHVNFVRRVNRYIGWFKELTIAASETSPTGDERTVGVKLLDAMIKSASHVDFVGCVDCYPV